VLWKNDVYLDGEASSPLYRRALDITIYELCGVWLRTERTHVWRSSCEGAPLFATVHAS